MQAKAHVYLGHWTFLQALGYRVHETCVQGSFSFRAMDFFFSHWDIAGTNWIAGRACRGSCVFRAPAFPSVICNFGHWDFLQSSGYNWIAEHARKGSCMFRGHPGFFNHGDIGISFSHRVIACRHWMTDQASTGQGYFREMEFLHLSSIMFAQGGFLGPNESITTKPKPRAPSSSHLTASQSESVQCPRILMPLYRAQSTFYCPASYIGSSLSPQEKCGSWGKITILQGQRSLINRELSIHRRIWCGYGMSVPFSFLR